VTSVLEDEVERMKLPDWLPAPGRDGMWGLDEIAEAAGLGYKAAEKWRTNYNSDIKAGRRPLGHDRLPKEDDTDSHGRPRWFWETIVRWMQQTGRMDGQMRPTRFRGRGGRPRGPRKPSQARDSRGRFSSGGNKKKT
jgi:hypothetical protein